MTEAEIRADERRKCWALINSWIKRGDLEGNGCDATAQRNGLILATNILMGIDYPDLDGVPHGMGPYGEVN